MAVHDGPSDDVFVKSIHLAELSEVSGRVISIQAVKQHSVASFGSRTPHPIYPGIYSLRKAIKEKGVDIRR